MKGFKVAGANASVSALDLCSSTLSLAIGNECGLVSLLQLGMSSIFEYSYGLSVPNFASFVCM